MEKSESKKIDFSRLTNRSFLVIMSVITFAIVLDSQIGIVADFISDSLITSGGIGLFVALAAVFILGQYGILEFVKKKNKGHRARVLHLRITDLGVRIAQYTLAAIFVIIIIQVLATSQYNSSLLMASTVISYGLLAVMFGLLTRGFLSWYRFTSRRNAMVLIFALAMASTLVYSVGGLTLFIGMLQQQPQIVTAERVAFFPEFEPGSLFSEVQLWYQVAAGIGFILTWIGVVMLLHPYAKKFGKAKFWSVMGVALFYHTIQIPLFMLGWYSPSENSDAMTNILTSSLLGIFTGIIFAIAFLSMARAAPPGSSLRDNMIIAACGFLLFLVAGTGTASQAAYPPFGLISVSFVGLASYMIYTGLYTSAISVSQDATLRISIKKSASDQVRLLDSIGKAEMEKDLQSRVLKVVKERSDDMAQETGIEPSMTEQDVKTYLDNVIKEIRTDRQADNKGTVTEA